MGFHDASEGPLGGVLAEERQRSRRPRRPARGRVGHLLSMPGAGILMASFLMPWAAVSCNGVELARATGYGVATGSWESGPGPAGKGKLDDEAKSEIRVPVELLGLPVLGLLVLGLGARALAGRGRGTVPVLWVGIACVTMLGAEAATDFGMDLDAALRRQSQAEAREAGRDGPRDAGISEMTVQLGGELQQSILSMGRFDVRPLVGYWFALGGAVLVALGGFLGTVSREPARVVYRSLRARRRSLGDDGVGLEP